LLEQQAEKQNGQFNRKQNGIPGDITPGLSKPCAHFLSCGGNLSGWIDDAINCAPTASGDRSHPKFVAAVESVLK
jgi:hypothetical protein